MKLCPSCGREFPDNVKFCPNDGQTLRAKAASADLVGQVVADRYHIIKKLGEGGMGAVYLGEHVKMGRKSAIKVMAASMSQDPDAISRFNREASNASRISHPNVCQIYDFGETPDGTIYLAMEFIEGQSLKDLVEKEGALPAARAAHIIRQAADALQAAHDLGIVHRDIKPDNIMIVRGKGGDDVVKVVDFGIARAVGGDEPGQKVTKTGLVVGTPEYMSPEQLSGDKLDGRSDIYSLALVLYRMVTGVLPFQADSAQETMIKRLTDDPAPLTDSRPDIEFPPKLQLVMNTALARRAEERYQTASEFGRDTADTVAGMAPPSTRVQQAEEGATAIMSKEELTQATRAQKPASKAAAAAAKPSRPAKRETAPTAVSPGKKSMVLPIVGGTAAVAALAAVVVIMQKGGGRNNNGADTSRGQQVAVVPPASPDTQKIVNQAQPPAPPPAPPSGSRPPAPPPNNPPPANPPPAPPSASTVANWADTLTAANNAFDDDQLGTSRGLALRSYPNLSGSQKTSAAILIANTYAQSRPDSAIAWFRRGLPTASARQRESIENLLRSLGAEP